MPMYEIEREEQGVRHATYRLIADNEEEARELIWEEDIKPSSEYFDQYDLNSEKVRELADCDCDICGRRGPWSCVTEDNEL